MKQVPEMVIMSTLSSYNPGVRRSPRFQLAVIVKRNTVARVDACSLPTCVHRNKYTE